MSSRLLSLVLLVAVVIAGCGSSGGKSAAKSTRTVPAKSTRTVPKTPGTTVPTAPGATTASSSSRTVMGFEHVPIEQGPQIAPASTTGTAVVDNLIKCGPIEQLAYHIHAHLAVYVDGQPRQLPGGIGIPGSHVQTYAGYGPVATGGSCIYWLHTHAPDGVIHIESPTQRIYTLGQFFDEWRQPLSSTQIGNITGSGTWIVNGKVWKRNPRDIPLTPHANIQLDIGQPTVPFRPINWSITQL